MSEIGGRMLCARVACGMPKLHDAHVGIYRTCPGFIKPERKKRREQMAAHSPKNETYYQEERIPEVIAIQGAACEARISERLVLPPRYRCTNSAVDIHEVVRRSEAGSLQRALEYATLAVCRNCHTWISRHPAGARAMGYELRLRDIAS